jgi:hypothetical protein
VIAAAPLCGNAEDVSAECFAKEVEAHVTQQFGIYGPTDCERRCELVRSRAFPPFRQPPNTRNSTGQFDKGSAPFIKRAFCSKAVAMTFGARRISSLR